MSILGLGEYDSPAASNQDDSPVAPAQQAEPSASGSAIRLSIVDYENDVDEKVRGHWVRARPCRM